MDGVRCDRLQQPLQRRPVLVGLPAPVQHDRRPQARRAARSASSPPAGSRARARTRVIRRQIDRPRRATRGCAGSRAGRPTPGRRRRRRSDVRARRTASRRSGCRAATNMLGRDAQRRQLGEPCVDQAVRRGIAQAAELAVAAGRGEARAVIEPVQAERDALAGQPRAAAHAPRPPAPASSSPAGPAARC